MDLNELKIDKDRILYNEPMKNHTTFKTGGPAEYLIIVKNEEELKQILEFVKIKKIPLTILGNGSNVLVTDKGIKGITLIIRLEKVEIIEGKNNIRVLIGAGEKLSKIARHFFKK